ncbi:MAG: hypothetical protein A2Z59_11330 [Nitrospinae bacterium RIFCSPLOWO2_02_39_17]|nr:MAG: hypothetical protein A2W53_03250 [Nitrospinae bacterium RIFCSPHIGHO2_02_39_11]OGW05575.1 MAG: hypothetical protein A2Z59_11330 [Nitrospinae bacterium RIFCSPLOWO2_02_39_17]OGW08295.1 MAG: hypothetical protein A2W75_09900 [Nitrospinae bacterium RIFCSPLOWO2_12_39_15]
MGDGGDIYINRLEFDNFVDRRDSFFFQRNRLNFANEQAMAPTAIHRVPLLAISFLMHGAAIRCWFCFMITLDFAAL